MGGLFTGILRRCFRLWLKLAAKDFIKDGIVGGAILFGYGLKMEYPDKKIWLYQMLEIVVDDCYGLYKLPAHPFVIDCGANIGTFTLFAKWRRPNARILAVEPSLQNRSYLRNNLEQVRGTDVIIVDKALGAKAGVVAMLGSTSDTLRVNESDTGSVELIPLSKIIDEPVDLLKIDVEGFEKQVIQGVISKLGYIKRIVIECHEYPGVRSDLIDIMVLLREEGFDRFRVNSLRDYKCKHPDMPLHSCLLHAWKSRSLGL